MSSSSTGTIDFTSSQFKTGFGDDIAMQHRFVLDAISVGQKELANHYLGQITDLVASAGLAIPNATHDIRLAKSLQVRLAQRIRVMPSRSSSSSSASDATKFRSPEVMKDLPPTGIRRLGQNCGLNALGQLFAGAWRIASKIDPESDLGKLIQSIYAAQESDTAVNPSFGIALRGWIGASLSYGAARDWKTEGNSSNTKQIDVLDPLHRILEEADVGFELTQTREFGGLELEEEEKREPEKHTSVQLQLSTDKLDFPTLLDAFFQNVTDRDLAIKKQFTKAPDDLIIEAQRFFQVPMESGEFIPAKEGSDLQNVPTRYPLPPKYTVNNENSEYELTGCIIHSGTIDGGHYTYLRRVGETWYYIDDAKVTEVKDPSPYIAQGYVYHYEKISAPAPKASDMRPRELPEAPELPAAARVEEASAPGPIVSSQKSLSETCLEYTVWAIGSLVSLVFNIAKVPAQKVYQALSTKK